MPRTACTVSGPRTGAASEPGYIAAQHDRKFRNSRTQRIVTHAMAEALVDGAMAQAERLVDGGSRRRSRRRPGCRRPDGWRARSDPRLCERQGVHRNPGLVVPCILRADAVIARTVDRHCELSAPLCPGRRFAGQRGRRTDRRSPACQAPQNSKMSHAPRRRWPPGASTRNRQPEAPEGSAHAGKPAFRRDRAGAHS